MSFSEIGAYLDSLIHVAIGAFFIYLGYFSSRIKSPRFKKILRICGPLLLILACILIPAKFSTPWKRIHTDDGIASAEFPGKVERTENSSNKVSYTYNKPGKRIWLRLSCDRNLEPERSKDEFVKTFVELASQQGLVLSSKESVICGDIEGFSFRFIMPDESAVMITRLVLHGDIVYTTIASFHPDIEMREDVQRFLSSFRIESLIEKETEDRNDLDPPGPFEGGKRPPRADAVGSIRGTIVDRRTGGPLKTDRCLVTALPHDLQGPEDLIKAEVDQGRFCIEGVQPGLCDLQVNAEGYIEKTVCRISVSEEKSPTIVRIELDSGGELLVRLEGFAREERGRVNISTLRSPRVIADDWTREWMVLGDGKSEMALTREAGEWLVLFAFDDDQTVEKKCTVIDGRTTEVVVTPQDLSPAKVSIIEVTGRFVHTDGSPIPGARLNFVLLDQLPDGGWPLSGGTALTDPDGVFSAGGFQWGSWGVEYYSDEQCINLPSFWIPKDSPDPFELDLVLPDGTVSGTACDGVTGLPLDESGPRLLIMLAVDDACFSGSMYRLWQKDGSFSLIGVHKGRYRITIDAKGFEDYFGEPFDHPGSGNVDLGHIRLERR